MLARKKTVTEKRWGFTVQGRLHDCQGNKTHAAVCRRLELMLYPKEEVSSLFQVTLTYEIKS